MQTCHPATAGMRAGVLIASAVALAAAPDGRDDREASTGRWHTTAIEINGKAFDPDITAMLSIVYGPDGHWWLLFKSVTVAEGASSADPATAPKSFEMQTLGSGRRTGRKYWGIYEMHGDRRRICFTPVDVPRPDSFSTAPGSRRILVEFARERPAGERPPGR